MVRIVLHLKDATMVQNVSGKVVFL